jgi:hypothetical protein
VAEIRGNFLVTGKGAEILTHSSHPRISGVLNELSNISHEYPHMKVRGWDFELTDVVGDGGLGIEVQDASEIFTGYYLRN